MPEHENLNPLYEKNYFPPDYGLKQVSRLYGDGSLYFLSQLEDSNENEGKWGFISTVKNAGLQKIKSILRKANRLKSDEIKSGTVKGIIIWKIPANNEVIEITTTIIPDSKLTFLSEINNLVNNNLNTIPSD